VTVLMTVFNGAQYLRASIDTVRHPEAVQSADFQRTLARLLGSHHD
jgi:hypothetical protein